MKIQSQRNNGAAAPGGPLGEDKGVVPIVRVASAARSDAAIPRQLWRRPGPSHRHWHRSQFDRESKPLPTHRMKTSNPTKMKEIPIIPQDFGSAYAGDPKDSGQAYQLAAIRIPTTTELAEEELRLWYYLAPFILDWTRIHYDFDEVQSIFRDYLPDYDLLLDLLVEAKALVRLYDGHFAPTAHAVSGGLLAFATPGEVSGTTGHGDRICYLTLRGILWLLRELGSEPHPYHHMVHPGKLLELYRDEFSNE